MLNILVVDDDETLRFAVRTNLEAQGYSVEEAQDGMQAVAKIQAGKHFDVALLDVNMPHLNGLETLAKVKETSPSTSCIMLTAFSDVKDAVQAIKQGAYDYLEKPVEIERIISLIESARLANDMVEVAANSCPTLQFDAGRDMIGQSSSMEKVFNIIYRLSKVDTSVLIRGESGTGKELVARALHFNSQRKKGPFVAVNCAAIPENLIESELFGHEKGAFTGADRKKIGKFQYASGGTIFLDEIGDISPAMQVKLLRILQEKVFTPVGANQELPADARVIAATNRPLEDLIKKSTFRTDLYYRLNVMPIQLPPLRDRREDVEKLADYMIKKFNKIHARQIKGLEKDALNSLRLYYWPGNIRELENVIEHAFIWEPSDRIKLQSLPEHIQQMLKRPEVPTDQAPLSSDKFEEEISVSEFSANKLNFAGDGDLNYPALKERFEKEFIIRALKTFNGRINQTAEHTQMTKVTLLRKLEKYGINAKEYHRR